MHHNKSFYHFQNKFNSDRISEVSRSVVCSSLSSKQSLESALSQKFHNIAYLKSKDLTREQSALPQLQSQFSMRRRIANFAPDGTGSSMSMSSIDVDEKVGAKFDVP